ncbi:MAG: homoserine O-acetyltransferase/O-succinyltransferase [Bacteroidales bacterium]|jgi:homoserine O-acetyltransferase|nr:homoserine O-acetyltransferase/O-succinyltransferase [Bacteroidales bacterium]
MDKNQYYFNKRIFRTETGEEISDLRIAYQTWGKLNAEKDNVIWVCHAYTANADAQDWWPGMIGPGLLMDTDRYFVICANVIGSCYGTTGPLDLNPKTGRPWMREFPKITVRDLIKAHEILRKSIGIAKIHLIIGGSIGAFQALEWSVMFPEVIENMVFIASSAFASPWNIAFNEAQRMAIRADPSFYDDTPEGGKKGLKAARAIALISYRNSKAYNSTQKDESPTLSGNFKAVSYQNYQGDKLVKRYNAYSYVIMSHLFDGHHIGRDRGTVEEVLSHIKAKTLLIALDTDQLFPPEEQAFMANHIPFSKLVTVKTNFGHDGFLIETEQITKMVNTFLTKE